jgi:hypothetical protein
VTDGSIELVLAFADARLADISNGIDRLAADGSEQDARLDRLEQRCGIVADTDPLVEPENADREPAESDSGSQWDDIVSTARRYFVAQGTDPDLVDVAALMDPADLEELRRITTSTNAFRCRLDATDLIIATVAGLAAAAVDVTIVKIPKTMRFNGAPQEGSSLTEYLRSKAVPSDNWLAELARVPFDSLNPDQPDLRLSPMTHRADTFGHDPLVGLVFGVIDIMRGTSTGVARDGTMFVRDIADPTTSNPLAAIVLELAHLLSDVGTRSGLPLPGWSLLRLVNAGSFGGQSVSDLARQMYLRGFNTWHLPAMGASVSAAEITLRAGWALRGSLDEDWAKQCDDEERMAGTTRTGNHPRFLMMSLLTHGIATAANAGKIAAAGGNPLAWNMTQWARFAQLIGVWWRSQPRSAADAICARSDINLERLLDGWPNDTVAGQHSSGVGPY